MANENGVIILGALDDSELKKSIDALVSAVNTNTKAMADGFDAAIDKMTAALKRLQTASGEAQDAGKNNSNGNKNEAESVKELGVSYDKLAEAQAKALKARIEMLEKTPITPSRLTGMGIAEVGKIDPVTAEQEKQLVLQRERNNAEIAEGQQLARNLDTQRQITEETKKQSTARGDAGRGKAAASVEAMRVQIARLNGIQESEVKMVDTTRASYASLSQYLAQLQKAYNKLGADWRNGAGRRIAAEMQEVERAMQRIKRQAARPVSLLSAMGMSERTLDDITRKMQALTSYRAGLNTATQAQEIRQVTEELDRLKKKQNEVLGMNEKVRTSNNALTRSFNYMKNRLAFYFTIGASTAFVKQLIEIRGQYEMTEKALGVLIGSAVKGSEVFNELSAMALKSPFTLLELSGAARQLTAYEIAGRNVVDVTRRMADMAAAVGAPIERLTYALGQIKAYGYLNARDARMFANAGIPLTKELADYYTRLEHRMVSVGDVYDRIKKKAVSFGEVMEVVNKMTDEGGRFFNFQEKMAETLRVQLANLTLAWNNMLNDIGASNQSVIEMPIKGLTELFRHWQGVVRVMTDVAIAFGVARAAAALYNVVMTKGSLTITRAVTAQKRATIERLEQKKAVEGLTRAEQRQLAAAKQVTAQDYMQELSKRRLSKAQLQLLVYRNRDNLAMLQAIRQMKLLKVEEMEQAAMMTRLQRIGAAFRSVGSSIANALAPLFSWQMLVGGFVMGLVDVFTTLSQNADNLTDFREKTLDTSKERIKNINKYLDDYDEQIQRVKAGVGEVGESNKLWESMREQIENNASAADILVGRLEQISNITDRVTAGEKALRDIVSAEQKVQDLSRDLDISQNGPWGGFWGGEGLKDDARDFQRAFDALNKGFRDANVNYNEFIALQQKSALSADAMVAALNKQGDNVRISGAIVNEYKSQLEEFYDEVDDSTASTIEQISKMSFKSTEEMVEVVRSIKKAYKDEANLSGDAAQLFDLRFDEQLAKRLPQYKNVLTAYSDEARMLWEKVYEQNKDYFRDMTAEELEQINWRDEEHNKMIQNALSQLGDVFAPDAYNKIAAMVRNANQLKISIPLLINVLVGNQGELKTDFQKYFDDRFTNNKYWDKAFDERGIDLKAAQFAAFRPTAADDLVSFGDKMLKNRKETTANVKKLDYELKKAQKDGNKAYEELARTQLREQLTARGLLTGIIEDFGFKEEEKKSKGGGGGRHGGGKKAEDIVANALRDEIRIINEIRSNYEKLAKSGLDDAQAIRVASDGYEKTIQGINAVLSKFGIERFKATAFAGKNVREVKDMLVKQLNDLITSGKVKLSSLKELDVTIQKLTVDARVFDMERVTEGLNNALEKLRNEYELGVELDADPELGAAFGDYLGIDTAALPREFDEVVSRLQGSVDEALRDAFHDGADMGAEDMMESLDILSADLAAWAKANGVDMKGNLYKGLEQDQKYLQGLFKKNFIESEKMLDELVKKRGEYSDKTAAIEKQRLASIKKLNQRYYTDDMRQSSDYLEKLDAVNKAAAEDMAAAAYEMFKGDPIYIRMFEKLEDVSGATLALIKQRIQDVIATMGDLKPDQLKTLTEQLDKVGKEQIRRNPFKGYFSNMRDYLTSVGGRGRLEREALDGSKRLSQQREQLSLLKQQREQMKANGQYGTKEYEALEENIKTLAESVQLNEREQKVLEEKLRILDQITYAFKEQTKAIAQIVGANLDSLADMRDLMKEAFGVEIPELDGFVEGISRANKGLQDIIAGVESGNFVGAVVGAGNLIYGIYDGIASLFGGGSAKNKKIDKQVKESERAVKELEIAYRRLERQVEKAMGTAETLAKRAAIANKQLALEEKRRQLDLEQGRKKKYKDEDKIADLRGEVQDLEYEIEDLKDSVVNDLLGSDIKGAAENFVSTWINAWKNGEDTMDALKTSFDDMIETMITKSLASTLVAARLRRIYQMVEDFTSDTSENGAGLSYGELSALRRTVQEGGGIVEGINTDLTNLFNMLGLHAGYGKGGNGNLSALQQGIQGMTEDQAGALEAYWNASVQQSYLHSELLQQIVTIMTARNAANDIADGTMAQMLLQMQASYQVQLSIQSMLSGWSNGSGRAVRVEMI